MGIIGTFSPTSSATSLITPVQVSWSAARNFATGSTQNFVGEAGASAYQLMRSFYLFDTSTIPNGAVVNSVTLVHPVASNFTNNSTEYMCVVNHSATDPISSGTNASTNFGSITLNGDTSYGSVNLTLVGTAVGTFGISLSAGGISNLVAGGTTRYAFRTAGDINNSDPGTNVNQYTITHSAVQIIVDYNPTAVLRPMSKFWGA